jgi:4-hydroxy-L-threonine phosphate dehydrogenase PdxA
MRTVKNILVTMGDPAGISGEIVVKAFAALARPKTSVAKEVRALLGARPTNLYLAGDAGVLARAARVVGAKVPVDLVDAFSTKAQPPGRIRLFGLSRVAMKGFHFGVPSYGREQKAYLDFAIEKARRQEIAAIVTGPITKEAVAEIEPGFVGHTGYLAEKLGVKEERMAFFRWLRCRRTCLALASPRPSPCSRRLGASTTAGSFPLRCWG